MVADIANLKHWRFHIDFEEIAWAVIDVAGQSQNTLGREPVEELEAIVSAVEGAARDKRVRGLIFMSGKEKSFIAGADIRELITSKPKRKSQRRSTPLPRFSTASRGCPSPPWLQSTASAWAAA